MDQLAAQPALNPAAVREEIHEAEEENSNTKSEKSSEVGIHISMEINYGREASSWA
jgi:hypothetical protein